MNLILLTALTMTAFAANSLLNRAALSTGAIDPIAFGMVRLIAGAVMLAVLVGIRRRGWAIFKSGRVLGVVSLFVYIFGFSVAYVTLDAGLGALILFGTVQITMFAAALIAREPMPPRRIIGGGIAALGLVWLLWPQDTGGGISILHTGLMIAAGIGWGVYSLIGRGAADPLGDTAANFLGAGVLGLCLLPLLPAQIDGTAPSMAGIALACLSGAITSGLGYALWYQIVPQLGATRAAISQLSVPVIAILAGAILLGEPVTTSLVIAAALVLAGVTLGLTGKRG